MGVLPLQFLPGESADTHQLTGTEQITIRGIPDILDNPDNREVTVVADGRTFTMTVRLDTARETAYYRHGGVLPYVLRQLQDPAAPS